MMRRSLAPVALLVLGLATACTFGKILRHGPSNVDDYRFFPTRVMTRADQPREFPLLPEATTRAVSMNWDGKVVDLDAWAAMNHTLALLMLSGDTIVYERYFNGHSREAVSLSFSMAKSFTSALVGCAIADGYIRSADQPVTDFVPELARRGFENVRLRHLLQMTAGTDYKDSDAPWAAHPALYYGDDETRRLFRMRVVEPPGTVWRYKSGEAELLGLALSRAIAPRTIADYMQERLWHPMGMEGPGLWAVDHEGGLEKTFCCLTARARDFLKFGRLYRDNGYWDGRPVVPAEWVALSTGVSETEGSPWNYQYQWWLLTREGDFYASGHLGQYLYVDRRRNTVLMRLGTDLGSLSRDDWHAALPTITAALDPGPPG